MLNAVPSFKSGWSDGLGGDAHSSQALPITTTKTINTTKTATLASAIFFHTLSVLLVSQFDPTELAVGRFPVCRASNLSLPPYLPSSLKPTYTCETLLGGAAVCIVAYCVLVVEYMCEYLSRRRQDSWIRVALTLGLVAGSIVVNDLTWLVLLVLPGVLNAFLVLALVWKWYAYASS